MSSEALDEEAVVARVRADPRLRLPRDRCRVLYELARWTADRAGERGEERYARISKGHCESFPATEIALAE